MGLGEEDLEDLTCSLIAAYQVAIAGDDPEAARVFSGALWQIGRCLAEQVGPATAGMLLN